MNLKEIDKKEILLDTLICILMAALSLLCFKLPFVSIDETNLFTLTYSTDKTIIFSINLLIFSSILGIIVTGLTFLALFVFKPSGIKPNINKKKIISLIILSLFGVLAYIIISILLSGFKVPYSISVLLSGLITPIYDVLIYKLYMEDKTYSNDLFWEIFRFAIVGLVAAIFDFLTCFIVQFVAFKGNENVYVTVIATICGFIIGVTINYIMSTYMVYKNAKTSFSKSAGGILTFLVLSAIGLIIGVLIQAFLYDFLFNNIGISFFTYPIDFVIRTLIVMVYNYISRKLIIYR